MANSAQQDVFRFRALRSPQTPLEEQWFRRYAKDNYIKVDKYSMREFQNEAVSLVGGLVFDEIVCKNNKDEQNILDKVLSIYGYGEKVKTGCDDISIENPLKKYKGIPEDGRYSFSEKSGNEIYTWYLSHTIAGVSEKLDVATKIIESHLVNFNKKLLICQLQNVLGVANLSAFVFKIVMEGNWIAPGTGNTDEFKTIKGELFDLLYFLFIAKRRFPVSLDHITRQIQTLHVIEYLGYDDFATDKEDADEQAQRKGCLLWFGKLIQHFKLRQNLKAEGVESKIPPPSIPPIQWKKNDPCDISSFTAIGPFVKSPFINNKEDLHAFYTVQPVIDPIFARLQHYFIPFHDIRPVGIADLKIVKQVLVRYEAGEVAHIENVLKGENKQKIHRRLDTIETFISDESERETDTNREKQTTDRNEMQNETARTINEAFNVNADVSAHYTGPSIDVTANAGFTYDRSTEDSIRNTQNFAKEVMQKSAERITQRVRSLRTTRRTSETEETNTHGLDNVKGTGHVRGIYRYVNKRYKAQVFNYGKRMMFEFLVPEPAEFYKKTVENKNVNAASSYISKNKKPKEFGINQWQDVTTSNIKEYISEYKTIIDEFPCGIEQERKLLPKILNIGQIKHDTAIEEIQTFTKTDISPSDKERLKTLDVLEGDSEESPILTLQPPITISKGCFAKVEICIAFRGYHQNNENCYIVFSLTGFPESGKYKDRVNKDTSVTKLLSVRERVENGQDDYIIDSRNNPTINFTIKGENIKYIYSVLHITEYPIAEIVDKWKEKTFNTLKQSYQTMVDEYNKKEQDDKKSHSKTEKENLFKIKGKNPEINKHVIREELHKHSITMFAKEFDKDIEGDLLLGNPVEYVGELIKRTKDTEKTLAKPATDERPAEEVCVINFDNECKIFPVINIEIAKKKGEIVLFLEQAFEWEKISYLLYPYFYGDKSRWMETYDHYDNDDNDTAFVAFLRAGYARVLVPVRPAYEAAVMHFLYTRKPWNGGGRPPVIGDDLYLPIHEEIRNQTDEYYGATPEGEPWEYTLPTSLIYLQEDGNLPDYDGEFPKKDKK